jgi:hypothetical protein
VVCILARCETEHNQPPECIGSVIDLPAAELSTPAAPNPARITWSIGTLPSL